MVVDYKKIQKVRYMNKKGFILELVNKTNLDEETCVKINDCLEENFIIGKNNKEKTISLLMERLSFSLEEANNIYNIASGIMAEQIKNKIKHPFKSQD